MVTNDNELTTSLKHPNANIFLGFVTQMTLYYCNFIPGISQNPLRLVLIQLKLVTQL